MKIASIKYKDSGISIAALILRLGLGIMMMISHGYDKLQRFSEISGNFSDPLRIGSTLSLSLTIFSEFFCAILVVIGLFTRIASFILVLLTVVIVFIANHGHFFSGGEKDALYLVGFLALVIMGPGKISLDRYIGK